MADATPGAAAPPRVILASGSAARRSLLTDAGLAFEVALPDVDEEAIRESLSAEGNEVDPVDVAEVLARAKAEMVSREHPGALVIGGDQVLALDGEIYGKAADMAEARRHLLEMRGRRHELHAAVVLALDGETVWSMTDTATLSVRHFSMRFIEDYLAELGPEVCRTVGCYKLEGRGIQLFDAIDGDYFTILGLPLLPLLAELRNRKVIPA